MLMTPNSNRLTELGLHEPAAVVRRRPPSTPAQQRAARANGRKSRGPRTLAGKARSSMNAVRHALLAKRLVPAADYRQLARLYWDIRTELIEEFKPSTFTNRALVDALAHDYLSMVRARRLIDSLVPAPFICEGDQRCWEQMTGAQHDVELLAALIAQLNTTGVLDINHADAQAMAKLLAESLAQTTADVAQADEEADGGHDDAVQDSELMAGRRLVDKIGPAASHLADADHLCELLSGRRSMDRRDRAGLRVLAAYTHDAFQRWIDDHAGLAQRLAAAEMAALRPLAAAPEKLLILTRYLARTERAIAEKVRRLNRK